MLTGRLREERYKVFQSVKMRDDPQWSWLPQATSGVQVDERAAYGVSAFYACVRAIAEPLGMLPRKVFERTANGKRVADRHRVYRLVHDQPNPMMTAQVFFEAVAQHAVSTGGSYSWIEYDRGAQVKALWLLRPDRTRVERRDGRLWYFVRDDKGREERFEDWEILHVPGIGWDGIRGYRPVELMAESLGIAIAQERFAGSYYGRGMHPSVVLQSDKTLSDDAKKNIGKPLEERHAGAGNAFRLLLLEDGLKWVNVGINAKEAQFLEGWQARAVDVARFMRVPASEIDAAGGKDSLTYSTLEQDDLRFMKRTLLPWGSRITAELNRKLFSLDQTGRFFVAYIFDAFLQADTKTRYEAHKIATGGKPWKTVNEVRRDEDLSDVEGGDELPQVASVEAVEPEPEPEPDRRPPREEPEEDERSTAALDAVFADACDRLLRRLQRAVGRAAAKIDASEVDREAWSAPFFRDFESRAELTMRPCFEALATLRGSGDPEELSRVAAREVSEAAKKALRPDRDWSEIGAEMIRCARAAVAAGTRRAA